MAALISHFNFLSAVHANSVCIVSVSDAEGEDDSTALNVLLVGSGDLRHVLTTLASSPRPVKVIKLQTWKNFSFPIPKCLCNYCPIYF